MLSDNLVQLRKLHHLTQEEVAERVGVTRQAVGKWESGETTPDLNCAKRLAEIFDVSLDELANHQPEDNFGLGVPPRGKHVFGMVTVGERGQIIIPAKARKVFQLSAGDQLLVLGDDFQGLALIPSSGLARFFKNIGPSKD